jgi:hypothetical protein
MPTCALRRRPPSWRAAAAAAAPPAGGWAAPPPPACPPAPAAGAGSGPPGQVRGRSRRRARRRSGWAGGAGQRGGRGGGGRGGAARQPVSGRVSRAASPGVVARSGRLLQRPGGQARVPRCRGLRRQRRAALPCASAPRPWAAPRSPGCPRCGRGGAGRGVRRRAAWAPARSAGWAPAAPAGPSHTPLGASRPATPRRLKTPRQRATHLALSSSPLKNCRLSSSLPRSSSRRWPLTCGPEGASARLAAAVQEACRRAGKAREEGAEEGGRGRGGGGSPGR